MIWKGGNAMDFALPGQVLWALKRLEDNGFAAFVVGGCVRDWTLGKLPHDYDICTAASPEEMKRLIADARTIETGIRHGTLTVVREGMPLEITTFRLDGEYLDGRHPASVRFTSRVEEDLSRRDFTINAMAYAPGCGVVDPFGGRQDCQSGVVRCVGEPERRFHEDALRILRALRFSARLGFAIEEKTARALRKGRDQLRQISRERVAAELTGLLMGQDAGRVIGTFPEVMETAVEDLAPLITGENWAVTLRRVDAAPPEEILRWAALLEDAGQDGEDSESVARKVMRELKMSARMTDAVAQLVSWAHTPLQRENLRELMMHIGPERLKQLILLWRADREARGENADRTAEEWTAAVEEMTRQNVCYTLPQLAVNGRDMRAIGLRGEQIGRMLEALLLKVVRGEIPNDREKLLEEARTAKEE